jgi:hypothetical protein
LFNDQINRIRKMLKLAKSIRLYERDLQERVNIIDRFAIVIVLRLTQMYYRCICANYLRRMTLQKLLNKESQVVQDILFLTYTQRA